MTAPNTGTPLDPPKPTTPGGELRTANSELAHLMYSNTVGAYEGSLRGSIDALRDQTGMSPKDAKAHLQGAADMYADATIPPDRAGTLHGLGVKYLAAPPDEETLTAWSTETRRLLRERYGDEADAKFAAVQAFVDARPEMKKFLGQSGLGSHPELIGELARRSGYLRITPRKR